MSVQEFQYLLSEGCGLGAVMLYVIALKWNLTWRQHEDKPRGAWLSYSEEGGDCHGSSLFYQSGWMASQGQPILCSYPINHWRKYSVISLLKSVLSSRMFVGLHVKYFFPASCLINVNFKCQIFWSSFTFTSGLLLLFFSDLSYF